MLRTVGHPRPGASIGALGLVGVIVGRGHRPGPATSSTCIEPPSSSTTSASPCWCRWPRLVFASATLGDPTEDGTLVYLWLRPVARWRIVAAAAAVVVDGHLAGRDRPARGGWPRWPAGGGAIWSRGTVAGVTVVMVGYVGLFVALGLRVKRALVWGLLYIFIWEGFVATANVTAARLAVRTYGRSVLEQIGHTTLRPTNISSPWSWIVPPVVGARRARLHHPPTRPPGRGLRCCPRGRRSRLRASTRARRGDRRPTAG